MANQEKVVTKVEENGTVDFETYMKEPNNPVTRQELNDILGGVLDNIGASLDEVAQPALSLVTAFNILVRILKEKGIVTQEDFTKVEAQYVSELEEVSKNG